MPMVFPVFMQVYTCLELQALTIFKDKSSSFNPTSFILTTVQKSLQNKLWVDSHREWVDSNRVFPMVESTWESTCPDPRRNESKENWKWVDAGSEWVDSIRIFQNWVDLGVDLFRPEGTWLKEKRGISQREEWVSRITQVSQNWVDLWVDLFGPEGFAPSHESTHRAETSKNELFTMLHLFCM